MAQVPVDTICTRPAEVTVQAVDAVLKVTVRPELEVAETEKSAAPNVLPGSAPKVIVCAFLVAVVELVTSGAAFTFALPA